MIEALWSFLLLVGLSHPASRWVAVLLAMKWAANYAVFIGLSEAAPVLVDLAAGAVGVMLTARKPRLWKDIVTTGFVLTPLIHAWYWIQHPAGQAVALTYYWLVIGVFTAQALATTWSGGLAYGRSIRDRLAVRRRDGLARSAGDAGARRGPDGRR